MHKNIPTLKLPMNGWFSSIPTLSYTAYTYLTLYFYNHLATTPIDPHKTDSNEPGLGSVFYSSGWPQSLAWAASQWPSPAPAKLAIQLGEKNAGEIWVTHQNIQNMGNNGNRTKLFPYSNQILWESNQQKICVTHQNRTSTSSNHRISRILCTLWLVMTNSLLWKMTHFAEKDV